MSAVLDVRHSRLMPAAGKAATSGFLFSRWHGPSRLRRTQRHAARRMASGRRDGKDKVAGRRFRRKRMFVLRVAFVVQP